MPSSDTTRMAVIRKRLLSCSAMAAIIAGIGLFPVDVFAQQYWDGAGPAGNGTVDGGTGTWNAANTNWTNAAGTTTTNYNAGPPAPEAVFQGTGGTVTVSGGQGITDLTFDVDGYVITGSQLAIHDSGSVITVTNGGETASISNSLTNLGPGSGSMEKQGAGTLVLSGNNSYGGGTTITAGTISVQSNSAFGSGSVIANAGTTIDYGNGVSISNSLVLNGPGGVNLNQTGGSATQSGNVSGTANLVKTGTGTLSMTGTLSHSGITAVNGGTLAITGAGSITTAGGIAVNSGTLRLDGDAIANAGQTLQLNGTSTLDLDGNEAVGFFKSDAGTTTDIQAGATFTINQLAPSAIGAAGDIQGGGNLTKGGAQTLILSGTNTYTGTTTVNAGILDLQGGAAIVDTGSVVVNAGGTLQVSTNETIGNIGGAGNIVLNANLTTGDATNTILSGVISGTGNLVKQGAGTMTLTGVNTYSGITTVNGGVLEFTGAGTKTSPGNLVVNSGGTLRTDGGALVFGQPLVLNGTGILDLDGNETVSFFSAAATTTTDIQAGATFTINQAANGVAAGNIQGGGSITKGGAAMLTLSGNNTFTGGIDHNSGTLVLASTSAAGTGPLSNAAILNVTANLVGGGLFTNESGGVANFGMNAITGFTGFQNDAGGTANFGAGSSFNAGANNLVNNGLINADGAVALTGGSFSNAGGISMQDGATGDALTINAAFMGGGGLAVDVDFAADAADTLIINGDVTGGMTIITLNDITAGVSTGNDILIIDGGGAMPANAFSLAAPVTSGAFTYDLALVGDDWFLTLALTPSSAVYEAYAAMLSEMNGSSSLQQRLGNRNWAQNGGVAAGASTYGFPGVAEGVHGVQTGLWARIEAAHSHHDSNGSDADQSRGTNFRKLHFGIDGPAVETGNGLLTAGLFGFVGSANTDVSSPTGDGSIDTHMYGAGGSLTWYGNDGSYLDAVGQFAWYKSDLESDSAGSLIEDADATGYTLSLEAGKRIYVSENWIVTPQAQITYSRIDFDDFADSTGSTVELTDGDSLKGRLGVAFGRETQWQNEGGMQNRSYAYLNLDLENEFFDGTEVDVSGTALRNEDDHLTGTAALGGSLALDDGRLSLFGEVAFSTSLENMGNSGSVRGNAGLKLRF